MIYSYGLPTLVTSPLCIARPSQDMVRTEVGEGEGGVPVLEASTTLGHLGGKAKAALDNLPYAPLLLDNNNNHSNNAIINRGPSHGSLQGSVVGGGSLLAATIDSGEINSLAAVPLPVSVLSETNMRDFVTNQSKMKMLLDRLAVVLKRVEADSLHSGYACHIDKSLLVPTAINIHLVPQLKPRDDLPFDSTLKHFPTLHKFERKPASERPVPAPVESDQALALVPPPSSQSQKQSQKQPPLSRLPSQLAQDKLDAVTVATATTTVTKITDTSPLPSHPQSPREKVVRLPRLRRAHQRVCRLHAYPYSYPSQSYSYPCAYPYEHCPSSIHSPTYYAHSLINHSLTPYLFPSSCIPPPHYPLR